MTATERRETPAPTRSHAAAMGSWRLKGGMRRRQRARLCLSDCRLARCGDGELFVGVEACDEATPIRTMRAPTVVRSLLAVTASSSATLRSAMTETESIRTSAPTNALGLVAVTGSSTMGWKPATMATPSKGTLALMTARLRPAVTVWSGHGSLR